MPRLPAKQPLIGGRDVAGTRPSSARPAGGGESTGTAPVSPIVKPRPLSAHAALCRRESYFAETSPEQFGFVRGENEKVERDSGEEMGAQAASLVGVSAEPFQSTRESSAYFSVDASVKSEAGAVGGSAPLATAATVAGSTAVQPAATPTPTLPDESSLRQSAAEEPTSVKLTAGESYAPEAAAGLDGGDGSDNISSSNTCEGDELDGVGPAESGAGTREGGDGDAIVVVNSGDDATAEGGENRGNVSSSADSPLASVLASHFPTIVSSRQTALPVSPSKPPRLLPIGATISSPKGITGDVRGGVAVRQGSVASQEGDGGAESKRAAAWKAVAVFDAANRRAVTTAKAAEDAARRVDVLQRAVETAAATAEGSAQADILLSRVGVADQIPCATGVNKSVSDEPVLALDVPPSSTEAQVTSLDKWASVAQDITAADGAGTLDLEAVVEQIPNVGADTDVSATPDAVPVADTEAIANQEGPVANADARVTEIAAASRSAQVLVADEARSITTPVDGVSAGEMPDVVGSLSPGVSDGKTVTARTMPLLATDGVRDVCGGDNGGGSGDLRVNIAAAEESVNLFPSSSVDMQKQNSETDTEATVVDHPHSSAEAPLNVPPQSTEPVSSSPAIAADLPKATTVPNTKEPAESPIPTATTASEETPEPSEVSAKRKVDAPTTTSPSTAPVKEKFGLLSHGMGGGSPTLATRSELLRRPQSGIGAIGGPGARVGLSSRASGTTGGLTVNTEVSVQVFCQMRHVFLYFRSFAYRFSVEYSFYTAVTAASWQTMMCCSENVQSPTLYERIGVRMFEC